ncbi:hypothetical protein ACWDSJ_11190 [Nocardia sp. NPDC003482]
MSIFVRDTDAQPVIGRWRFRSRNAVLAAEAAGTAVTTDVEDAALTAVVANWDADRILHVEYVLDIIRPLVAGEPLDADVLCEAFHHYRDYRIVSLTTRLRDRDDELVHVRTTTLLIQGRLATADDGARTSEPDGALVSIPLSRRRADPEAARAHANSSPRPVVVRPTVGFDSLRVGTALPPHAVVLGAHKPPPPWAIGLGLAAGYVGSWAGDPAALTRCRLHYAPRLHRTPGPGRVVFRGQVGWLNPRCRTATIVVDADAGEHKLFGYATAEVRLG